MKGQRHELLFADDISHGFVSAASFQKRPILLLFPFRKHAIELEIKLKTAETQEMGEEEFRIQTGGGGSSRAQVFRAFIQRLFDG